MKTKVVYAIFFLILCVLILAMTVTISRYLSFKTNVAFLLQKQDYISNSLWLTSFYVHVFSAVFCLMAGLTQFSNYILREHKSLHRTIGKLYVYAILFVNVPSGLILALYANGGLVAKSAFIALDLLWLVFTLLALYHIKNKLILLHRSYMIRSYALTLSVLTFRLLRPLLEFSTELDKETIYKLDAWLAFTINLFVAEIIIRKKITKRISAEVPGYSKK